jgi:hypothetical protein
MVIVMSTLENDRRRVMNVRDLKTPGNETIMTRERRPSKLASQKLIFTING